MAGRPPDVGTGLRLSAGRPGPRRWVCLDVGETLIDETRAWSGWADLLGIPRMTFLAAFGAIVAAGRYHAEVFDLLEVPDWQAHADEAERRYGGFQIVDLYPDALPAIAALRAAGYGVSVIANQPASREAQLRAIGVRADVMGMSGALGVSKPETAFFERALRLMGDPAPADVAYVGDRPDNDVAPAAAAGMRAVWLRRGPWGVIAREAPEAYLVVRSLQELVERLPEAWPEDAAASTLA